MDTPARLELDTDRVRLEGWVSRARWALIAFGLTGAGLIAARSAKHAAERTARAARQAEELAQLHRAVKEDNENLAGFLHSLVHEMRSPLTVIAGYADMLRTDGFFPDEPSRRQAIEAVISKADVLNEIIEELLLTARMDRGGVDIQVQELDLAVAVEEAVQRINGHAETSRAVISVDVAAGSIPVAGDPLAVERILDNLLDNAINYGGDHPRIELTSGVDSTGWVRVHDHGVGIAALMRERVFDRFVRVGEDANLGGTGLGLFLARGLARQQAGDLELEWSELGQGSVFLLRLPSLDQPSAHGATPEGHGPAAGSPGSRG